MKLITKLLAVTFLLFTMAYALPTINHAAIPHLINYQGRLTDSQGAPITGTKKVTFKIYAQEAAGSPLWSETYNALTIDRGIFSVMLGGATPLNLAFDQQYYLAIQIESDPEMYPRQRLASSAYAFRAENANNVSGVVPIANGGTGQTTASAALNTVLPSQGGNAGKVLKTDGSNVNWGVMQMIPDDGSVSQAKLKTAVGEISTGGQAQIMTLPGGEYGFYPQIRWDGAGYGSSAAWVTLGYQAGTGT